MNVHLDFVEVMNYTVKTNDRYGDEINKQVKNIIRLFLFIVIIAFFSCIYFQKTVRYWLAGLKNNQEIKLSDEHKAFKWSPADEASVLAQYKEMEDLIRKAEEYLANEK